MSGAVIRMISRRGTAWAMKTWVEGSADAYKDKTRTLSAATNITAIRTETAKEVVKLHMRGEERTIDVQLLMADTVDVSQIEDTTKKAPIVTSPSGEVYDMVAVGREGELLGFRRAFLSKRRSGST